MLSPKTFNNHTKTLKKLQSRRNHALNYIKNTSYKLFISSKWQLDISCPISPTECAGSFRPRFCQLISDHSIIVIQNCYKTMLLIYLYKRKRYVGYFSKDKMRFFLPVSLKQVRNKTIQLTAHGNKGRFCNTIGVLALTDT